MKSCRPLIMTLSLLTLLAAGCGKDNKSGKSANTWDYTNPYTNGYSPYTPGTVNSPYNYGGISVNQVMQENTCTGYAPMQRIQIQIPLVNFPTTIAPNDVYVGVTSYGDVATLVGTAPGQPPMFVGYMCPRAFSPQGQGQLMGIKIGAYTKCLFKPITAATIVFPGGATAEFRWLDGGRLMTGQRFSFCSL